MHYLLSSLAHWHVFFAQQADADNIRAPDGSALDFKELLDPWFNQMGFPLLTVANSGDGTAEVTSARFFNPVEQSPDTPSYFKWVFGKFYIVVSVRSCQFPADSCWVRKRIYHMLSQEREFVLYTLYSTLFYSILYTLLRSYRCRAWTNWKEFNWLTVISWTVSVSFKDEQSLV